MGGSPHEKTQRLTVNLAPRRFMNENEFSEKYLNKVVRYKGQYYKIPTDASYKVTTALYHQYDEGGLIIFAIMSEKWNPPINIDWFTIVMSDDDLKELDNFEILN